MDPKELVRGKVYEYRHPGIRGYLCGEFLGRCASGVYKFSGGEAGPWTLNEPEVREGLSR